MKRLLVFAVLLLGAWTSLPAAGQLQYFGYVGNADDDAGLLKTRGYTNFAHVSSREYLYDSFVTQRVNAISAQGMKATIDLGLVLWCNYDWDGDGVGDGYRQLCGDFVTRWNTWKQQNASVLTSDKVLAFAILDEPFARDANMQDYDYAAAMVKQAFPWARIWMVEAACVIQLTCREHDALASYTGTLPSVDWIGLDIYGIRPKTDATFLNARARLKQRFPGKKWLYVMDGYWDPEVHWPLGNLSVMGTVARDWYDVAKADTDAVLLGGFLWPDLAPGIAGTSNFTCPVQTEHVAIGRAVTGKVRPQSSLPIGSFTVDSNGVASGWVCDPDATLCEIPRAEIYVNGVLAATPALSVADTIPQAQCGTGFGYRFKHTLPRHTAGSSITVKAHDLTSGVANIPSTCAGNPGCTWTPHLQHFGYVGGADDDNALNQTKGYTNFAHIATDANVSSTLVRDRVLAMSQKGIKATIDLGKVFWCGSSYAYLCGDYQTRWNTWKATNASILTSDKVLAFAIRDEPFYNKVNIAGYETAAQLVKTDFPWAKIFLVEAACAVRGSCHGSSHTAFASYAGTMPNVDWVGVDEYAIRPTINTGYKTAVQKLKTKFPGKKTVYIMDGYWDAAHSSALGSQSILRTVAQEWHTVARDDYDSVLLGVFLWGSLGVGTTGSGTLPCYILEQHVAIGREITGKVRAQTAAPVGRLEGVYSGNVVGTACDPDGTVCENPVVQLYRDGSYYSNAYFLDRNDYVLNPSCGTGRAIRFRQSLGTSASGYRITATAKDLDSATAPTLPSNCLENPACLWYSNYADAKGYMEDMGATGTAAGWVCDPDAAHLSTQVKLMAGSTVIGVYTTNLDSEQAVANECGGGTKHRFSVQLPPWTQGQSVTAYAVDLSGYDVLIPWLCSDWWTDNWSCSW
ncbi:MAG TPA: hypothetical protein VHN15_07120 [Thermoanaerobaculia bacterium]|nr:hypothetical protein [Thermoanaerobaculia bacterium]